MDVLHRRKAGADGESEDRRVDQKSDSVAGNEEHDDQTLEDLFDHRRDVPCQRGTVHARTNLELLVDDQAHHRRHTPREDRQGDQPPPHQLVAIEQDQSEEKSEDRQQTEEQQGAGVHDWHLEQTTGC